MARKATFRDRAESVLVVGGLILAGISCVAIGLWGLFNIALTNDDTDLLGDLFFLIFGGLLLSPFFKD